MQFVQLLRCVSMTIADVSSGCCTNTPNSDRQADTFRVPVLDPVLDMAGPFQR